MQKNGQLLCNSQYVSISLIDCMISLSHAPESAEGAESDDDLPLQRHLYSVRPGRAVPTTGAILCHDSTQSDTSHASQGDYQRIYARIRCEFTDQVHSWIVRCISH
jgi:hypothetical protein